jgi:general secretion pathway protein H
LHRRNRFRRGVTLIEVMIVLALLALVSGGAMMGIGALGTARLRQSATLVTSAIRVAYTHASQSGKPTRLVFDFETRSIAIEQAKGRHFVQARDRTGGAEAATDAEKEAIDEAEGILKGPRAPRTGFEPAKPLGFSSAGGGSSKQLESDIFFRRIEVDHEDDPVTEQRVYLYFWPGGQTQRAAIQLQQGGGDVKDNDILTLTVAPLTGKVRILSGPFDMPRPRSDEEESERDGDGL